MLSIAILGVGGYAAEHHRAIRHLEAQGQCRLIATCDPDTLRLREAAARFQFAERNVRCFPDYRELLDTCANDLNIVTIPTPVPLHAPMHRACIEHGLACYLEKPPTLYDVELEGMIACEAAAPFKTQVGFNFIVEPERQALKRRVLDGEFGNVESVAFSGLWPRPASYFQRASWAGRLMMDGRPVLDSCFGNAMAHYLHNLLFWAGTRDVLDWAEIARVYAELYRVHPIEGADTAFLRAALQNGIELRVAATHACTGSHRHREEIHCTNAVILYTAGTDYRIVYADGRQESAPVRTGTLLEENLTAYFRYCNGEDSRPLTRLEDSRSFVRLNVLTYIAAGQIHTVPMPWVDAAETSDPAGQFRAIAGIESAVQDFVAGGQSPGEQGRPWGVAGNTASAGDCARLRFALEGMLPTTRTD